MNILVVDDERIILRNILKTTQKALELMDEKGSYVFGTSNWSEALEHASGKVFDVALLDMELPGITGIELGEKLKKINPKINLIYVTAYSQYAVKANALHISGYLLKPVNYKDIMEELKNLRYNNKGGSDHEKDGQGIAEKGLFIHCFGSFEVYEDGKPFLFRRNKTKELFAFLIDHHGCSATTDEICAAIYEDDKSGSSSAHKNSIRVLAMELRQLLEKHDLGDNFIHTRNAYSIAMEGINCDYFDYLAGNKKLYDGKYMEQYSYWAYF